MNTSHFPDPLEGDLLDRYLAGALDAYEAERVRAFLEANVGRRGVMAGVFAWMRGEDLHGIAPGVDVALAQLTTEMERRAGVPNRRGIGTGWKRTGRGVGALAVAREGRLTTPLIRHRLWATAVAFGCIIAVAIAGWSVVGAYDRTHHGARSVLTYTTGNGERANITLPDGNSVALGVASRLQVPADYVAGDHVVHLDGEALFTITHREGAPFMVTTNGETARVLGTTFLVRRYAMDTATVIAVREGKVSMQSVVLTAGREGVFMPTGMPQVRLADPARFSFAFGVLTLDGISLRNAIPDLNRWYDADIRLGDSVVAKRRIVGGFPAGSLADLTELLELTFDLRVVRNGRIVTLYQK